MCAELGLPRIRFAYDTTGTRLAGKCKLLVSFLHIAKGVLVWLEQRQERPFHMTEDVVQTLFEMEGVLQLGAMQTIITQYETLYNGSLASLMKDHLFRTLK